MEDFQVMWGEFVARISQEKTECREFTLWTAYLDKNDAFKGIIKHPEWAIIRKGIEAQGPSDVFAIRFFASYFTEPYIEVLARRKGEMAIGLDFCKLRMDDFRRLCEELAKLSPENAYLLGL